jgi:two-component system, OmpR family, sensor kinase
MFSVIDRLRPHSLRHRIILWYTILIVLLFGILSLITYFVQANTLQSQAQARLDTEEKVVQVALKRQIQTADDLAKPITIPEVDAYTTPGIIVEIVDCLNTLRYTSVSQGTEQRLPLPPTQCAGARPDRTFTTTHRIQGQRVQVETVPITANNGQVIGFVHVAHTSKENDDALATLRWALASATCIALGLSMLMGRIVTRQAFYPLTIIARTAQTITSAVRDARGATSTTLRQRIPAPEDADEVRMLVDAVNQMLDALADNDERQRQFTADASHELRTPLTTIRGNLELLRRIPDLAPSERDLAIQQASTEAERMAELLNDLLSLARTEAERTGILRQDPVEIDVILVDVFQVALERSRRIENQSPKVRVDTLEPVQVLGDAAQLRQVLLILIDNAFKYAPQSTITLGAHREGSQISIKVQDTGPGIQTQDLPHIFDRFYRAKRIRDREGSGLGLAIAFAIIQNHHGTLSVVSTPGQGTTFTVTLPTFEPASNTYPIRPI